MLVYTDMRNHEEQCLLEREWHVIINDADSSRIFNNARMRIEKVYFDQQSQRLATNILDNVGKLEISLEEGQQETLSMYFLQQRDTWSRIDISDHAFIHLVSSLHVFKPIWNIVQGFGFKTDSKDENLTFINSSISSHRNCADIPERFEICYNMRYLEKHGRSNTKTIWSERQTAIYQCIDLERDKSTWIVIQASAGTKALLKRSSYSSSIADISVLESLQIHTQLALELSRNWRSYINYLDAKLAEIDDKALDSRVDREKKSDYLLTFGDVQVLEHIRRKLLKASLLLRSNIDLAESLMAAFRKIISHNDMSNDFETLRQHKSDLARHLQVVNVLLDRLSGTSKLLFHILEYRQDERNIKLSHAIKENGEQIKKLNETTLEESDRVTQLTRDIHKDSKYMKAFALIALVYTPASLVASILSSNLIQVVDSGQTASASHMVLVSDFWKYPLITLAMITITLLLGLGWRNIKLFREST